MDGNVGIKTVQHRSDLLMEEQLCDIKQAQDELQSILQEMEVATRKEIIQTLSAKANALKARSQRLMLVFQVMTKIKSELTHARADLSTALHAGTGDVNSARKRVIWLEDKMWKLSSRRNQKLEDTDKSSFGDPEIKENDSPGNLILPTEGDKTERIMHSQYEEEADEVTVSLSELNAGEHCLKSESADYKELTEQSEEDHSKYVNNESEETEDEREENEEKNRDENIFITEVEEENAVKDQPISFRDPQIVGELAEEAEYKKSEQQKFEYSDYAHVLTEINPHSYHLIGLSVLESFITEDKTSTKFCELPWREKRKQNAIKDIHRVALDKLALRVHSLYGQVYDAAMTSVKPKPQEAAVSLEWVNRRPSSSENFDTKDKSQNLASERQNSRNKSNKQIEKDMKGRYTKQKDNLVFQPKPIPSPRILPIARTNTKKEWPLIASSFCRANRPEAKPAEGVVKSCSIMQENKLVPYRTKTNFQSSGSVSHTRKLNSLMQNSLPINRTLSGKSTRPNTRLVMSASETGREQGLKSLSQPEPCSERDDYTGLRWERVKRLVQMNLESLRVKDRIDAVKQLGSFGCGDPLVMSALNDRLHNDENDQVRYEVAKSLILIGCWETDVIENILKYLILGDEEIRLELMETLSQGKNIHLLNTTMPSFLELVKVLSHFCCCPNPEDAVAFSSAITLCILCGHEDRAQARLLTAVQKSADIHVKAKAIEVLVKQLNYIDDNIIKQVLSLLCDSPIWKYRFFACQMLAYCGPDHDCIKNHLDKIYLLLEQHLWDDPSTDVKYAATDALKTLGLYNKACDHVTRKLKSHEEDDRAQGAIAVGILGMKTKKIVDLLLDILNLDASERVRINVIRTFGILRLKDHKVLHCLKVREKLNDALARESRKVLRNMGESMTLQVPRLSEQLSV